MIFYAGIDPGASGGIAICGGKSINAHKCPDNAIEMSTIFKNVHSSPNFSGLRGIIEHVWAFPTDSGKTAFKFGQNFGSWISVLQINEIDYSLVIPRKWQAHFKTPKMEKKERKRWLKDLAQKYVDESDSPFKVTFNISDAILIALYLKETDKKKGIQNDPEC